MNGKIVILIKDKNKDKDKEHLYKKDHKVLKEWEFQ